MRKNLLSDETSKKLAESPKCFSPSNALKATTHIWLPYWSEILTSPVFVCNVLQTILSILSILTISCQDLAHRGWNCAGKQFQEANQEPPDSQKKWEWLCTTYSSKFLLTVSSLGTDSLLGPLLLNHRNRTRVPIRRSRMLFNQRKVGVWEGEYTCICIHCLCLFVWHCVRALFNQRKDSVREARPSLSGRQEGRLGANNTNQVLTWWSTWAPLVNAPRHQTHTDKHTHRKHRQTHRNIIQ